VSLHFVNSKGRHLASIDAPVGATLLEVAQKAKLDVEGACGGQCACATCHMILPREIFDKLPSARDDELDMLDLAAEVENASRLGCQVKVVDFMENAEIRLPSVVISQLD
jgi:ferredoxin